MRFPPAFLDDIRARVPLSTVVGQRVAWDKRKTSPGRGDFWACCPFHGEKTPSFHVEDRKGRYHCFGCGVSGDHFRFLTDKDGLSFPEAVEQLAALAGLPMPKSDPEAERRYQEEASLHEVMELACRFFEASLQTREGAPARGYLLNRRLGPEVQKRFRLGYAPSSRNALKEHLAQKGVSLERMIEAGLLVSGDDIPVAYDRFRDRVIFPITDARGRVVAFGGRAMAPDVPAKYLNSPETPLFSKGSLLYNLAEARKAADDAGTLVVVEGYVDVIAAATAGFAHSVAPLGTALTDRQLELLWKIIPEPILCFDGDAAGQRAALRAVDLALPMLRPGKSLRFAMLPEGQDPDDLIGAAGPAAFASVLAEARPLVDMIWARETEGAVFETPERRAELEQRLRAVARSISDASVGRHYDQVFRERVHDFFAPQARQGFGQGTGRDQRGRGKPGSRGGRPDRPALGTPIVVSEGLARLAKRNTSLPLREIVLVMTPVNHPGLLAERLDEFAHLDFQGRELDGLRGEVLHALAEDPAMSAEALRRHLDAAGLSSFIARLDAQLRRSGTWQALPEADDRDAEEGWLQAIALQKKSRTLHKELREAQAALAEEPSEANFARMVEIQRLLASAEGTEALIEGFGASSGRRATGL